MARPRDKAGERAAWFADTLAAARGPGGAEIGDHAQALLVELETVFAAGAWLATVILAVAVVEAHLRERALAEGRASIPTSTPAPCSPRAASTSASTCCAGPATGSSTSPTRRP